MRIAWPCLALAILMASSAEAAPSYSINTYCAEVSETVGGSYSIEQTCREQEREARSWVRNQSIEPQIEEYCSEVGRTVGGSYSIYKTCVQQERGARDSMTGGGSNSRVKELGRFESWHAFTFMNGDNRVCYMASQPLSTSGNYTGRDKVFAMVTHRPDKGAFNVVSFVNGYRFKEDSRAKLTIDGQLFTLFTHKDTVWAPDKETDERMVRDMRRGEKMRLRGTSTGGIDTVDTYSLLGFTAAHKAINERCNLDYDG